MYTIIEVPYHLGMQDVAVGKGPANLIAAGIDHVLGHKGMPAVVNHIRPRDLRSQGLDAVVDINRMLRYAVKEASEQDTVPVVLSGNCNACIGTLAALDVSRLGIVWFDKHPDFNTPETSVTSNIEGMSLAIATGGCHKELRERIGLNECVVDQNVVLACCWDVDPGEQQRLEDSWVSVHPSDSMGLLPVALHQLRERVDAVYFHIDTDFVDGVDNPHNFVSLVLETLPLAAVGIANYNPDKDPGGSWKKEILRVVEALQPKRN